jgi:hypothetical protein
LACDALLSCTQCKLVALRVHIYPNTFLLQSCSIQVFPCNGSRLLVLQGMSLWLLNRTQPFRGAIT